MPRLIPSAERIKRARALIRQARELPVPAEFGKSDLTYIAGVKSLLREARDLVKFIPQQPSSTPEMKEDVGRIYQEIEQADREILH